MSNTDKLAWLKVDLGITVDAYDARLSSLLSVAKKEIEREGAKLRDDSVDDDNLQIMYAAWLWRRRDEQTGMPRMLRRAMNNRIFAMDMETPAEPEGESE